MNERASVSSEWHLTVPADDDPISPTLEFIRRYVEAMDFPSAQALRLELVVEELIVNVFEHGRASGEQAARIDVSETDEGTHIRLSDNGHAFDPRVDAPRDTRADEATDRPVGGLGWPLIKHYCRIVAYERTTEGGEARNNLTLLVPKAH